MGGGSTGGTGAGGTGGGGGFAHRQRLWRRWCLPRDAFVAEVAASVTGGAIGATAAAASGADPAAAVAGETPRARPVAAASAIAPRAARRRSGRGAGWCVQVSDASG